MDKNKKITIEIIYAKPLQQYLVQIEVATGSSIIDAIIQSGILEKFPEIDLQQQKVGVFSKIKLLTDIVQNGDRIEIYRPLLIDPKDARKKRIKKKN